jgi:hypothetical protein
MENSNYRHLKPNRLTSLKYEEDENDDDDDDNDDDDDDDDDDKAGD